MHAHAKKRIGAVAVGALGALVGLLPWLLTGARLPLQNLWGSPTLPQDMPIAFLPFSQYYVTSIAAMIVMGAVIPGVVAASIPSLRRAKSWVLLGVAGTHVIAFAQSALVVLLGLRGDSQSRLYFGVLSAAFAFLILIAAVVCVLSNRAPSAAWLVGTTTAASLSGMWVQEWARMADPVGQSEALRSVLQVAVWIPSVLVAAAIIIVGAHTVGRLAAALWGLLLVWVVPALAMGVVYGLGSRVALKNPAEAAAGGLQLFQQVLFMPAMALPPLVVAVVLAVSGLTIRYLVGKRR